MVEESKTDKSPVIGIDLGTSFTCVGYWNEEIQSVEIIKNKAGNNTMPSWVSYGYDGTTVDIGEAAKDK